MRANRIVIRDATTEPYAFLGTTTNENSVCVCVFADSRLSLDAILFCCRLLRLRQNDENCVYTFCIQIVHSSLAVRLRRRRRPPSMCTVAVSPFDFACHSVRSHARCARGPSTNQVARNAWHDLWLTQPARATAAAAATHQTV